MKTFFFALFSALIAVAAPAGAMTLQSPDIHPNATIPLRFVLNGFGCTGQDQTPTLTWSGVPKGAKALALTIFDPDAPTTVGFVHYLLLDIPATATSTANAKGAVSGLNDFGKTGYVGPCPPAGDKPHHYIFTLYALDAKMPFGPTTTYAFLRFGIRGHVLAQASFTALYGH